MYLAATVLTFLRLCPTHSQATDTQEDRNHPGFLYNKMELGDLNANFTIEVDSQVICAVGLSESVASFPRPASLLYAFVSQPS